jgi:hypothetical protein
MQTVQLDSMVDRLALDIWGAFDQLWPDERAVVAATQDIWPIGESEPRVPSQDGPTTRQAWRWEPDTQTLSISLRSRKNGRWNADVVALVCPGSRWIHVGTKAPSVFETDSSPETPYNPDSIVLVVDGPGFEEFEARLRNLGMDVIVAREDVRYGSLDRFFPLVMQGWGLVSLAELQGSQPVVHLALREASNLRTITRFRPFHTMEFMDVESEANRSTRLPFMVWHSDAQRLAIESAAEA